jgi:hypothetical protein
MSLTDELMAWSEPPREAGQICYEAYAGALGWEQDGAVMPPWEKLTPRLQDAFRAGAHDVMQRAWTDGRANPAGRHARHG